MISIVVPVYNVEKYLDACLNSLLNQTGSLPEYEVVCVNDGSTDGSPDILKRYAARSPLIRVIDQPNKGLSGARNSGLAAATHDFILFVDSDDALRADALSQLAKAAAEQNPDLILFDLQHTAEDGRPGAVFQADRLQLPTGKPFRRSEYPQVLQFQHSAWTKMYRRDFLLRHQLRFASGIWFEDLPFFHQCMLADPLIVYVPEPLYLYRQRMGSIAKSSGSSKNKDIIPAFSAVLEAYRNAGELTVQRPLLKLIAFQNIYTGILFGLGKSGNKETYHEIKQFYLELFGQDGPYPQVGEITPKQRQIAKLIDRDSFTLMKLWKRLSGSLKSQS